MKVYLIEGNGDGQNFSPGTVEALVELGVIVWTGTDTYEHSNLEVNKYARRED